MVFAACPQFVIKAGRNVKRSATIVLTLLTTLLLIVTALPVLAQEDTAEIQEYDVPAGLHPHDVAPAPDGTVWYTAQATGQPISAMQHGRADLSYLSGF